MNKDQLALLEGLNDIQELSAQELFEVAGGTYGYPGTTTPPVTYPYLVPASYGPYGTYIPGHWVTAPPPQPPKPTYGYR